MIKEIKKTTCLRNSIRNLNLASVYLKHLDTENIPRLTTIYEFNSIIENTYQQIDNIEKALPKNNSEYALKGMFTLVITHFEVSILDLITKVLKFYPEKLDSLSKRESKFDDWQFAYMGLEKQIDFKVHKLGYKNIEDVIQVFQTLFDGKNRKTSLFKREIVDQLIEIKETRNLLVHNNLIVNQFYLNNTKTIKRSNEKGTKLIIDNAYLLSSIKTIKTVIEAIQLKVIERYQNYTLIELLKRLWEFTFINKHFVTIDKFCTLNYDNDTIDGPFKIDDKYSSSEKLYMEFWRAQRTSTKLESSFSMVNLSDGSKLSFLADVFGELRMTYW